MSFHDPRAGCMGKVRYSSPQAAHDALAKLTPKLFRHRWKKWTRPEPQQVYRCECGCWHLGRSQ